MVPANNYLDIIYAPELDNESNLNTLLASSARVPKLKSQPGIIYWNESHYGLDKTAAFRSLTEDKQNHLLLNLNHLSLSLAYYIEKFGMHYGSKMIGDSVSLQEKSLYGIFTHDEIRHRLFIENHLHQSPPSDISFHPLLLALKTSLDEGHRDALIFTLQVILEGFGISYYHSLKQNCLDEDLKNCIHEILKDEAHHHGLGVTLTQQMQLDDEAKAQITELTILFLRALVSGRLVFRAMDEAHGGLTGSQRTMFTEQIQWHQLMSQRIERIKSLLHKVGFTFLIKELEVRNVFTDCLRDTCTDFHP